MGGGGSPFIRTYAVYVGLCHVHCSISVEATFPRNGQTISSDAIPHYELFQKASVQKLYYVAHDVFVLY
jgi:hypothetical protein